MYKAAASHPRRERTWTYSSGQSNFRLGWVRLLGCFGRDASRPAARTYGDVFDDLSAGAAVAILLFVVVLLTSPLADISIFFAEWMLALLLIPLVVAYRIAFRR